MVQNFIAQKTKEKFDFFFTSSIFLILHMYGCIDLNMQCMFYFRSVKNPAMYIHVKIESQPDSCGQIYTTSEASAFVVLDFWKFQICKFDGA